MPWATAFRLCYHLTTDEVGRTAAWAGGQFEDVGLTVGALFVSVQEKPGIALLGVGWMAPVKAEKGPLQGAGEDVVAGRQQGDGIGLRAGAHRQPHQVDHGLGVGIIPVGHLGGQLGQVARFVQGIAQTVQASVAPQQAMQEAVDGIGITPCAGRLLQGFPGDRFGHPVGQGQVGQSLRGWSLRHSLGESSVQGGGTLAPRCTQLGHLLPQALDDILASRVVLDPLKALIEDLPSEAGDGREVLAPPAQGSTGGDAAQASPLAAHHPVLQPAQQHGDLDARRAVVDVGLVQHDEAPEPPRLAVEELTILGPEQQVLQHGVVGDEDVGRRLTHPLAADQLIGQEGLVGELLTDEGFSAGLLLFGLARVAAKSNGGVMGQVPAEALQLVVGQGVHGIEEQRPHARLSQQARLALAQQVIEDGDQESLGLATAGAGGHHHVAPCPPIPPQFLGGRGDSLLDGLILVQVEGALEGQGI